MPAQPARTQNAPVKLAIAVALLVVALGLLAWYYELPPFRASPPPAPSAEELRAYQQQQEEIKQQEAAGVARPTGAD